LPASVAFKAAKAGSQHFLTDARNATLKLAIMKRLDPGHSATISSFHLSHIASRIIPVALLFALAFAPSPVPGDPVRADQGGHHKAPARAPQHRIQVVNQGVNIDTDFKPHKRPDQGKLSEFDPIVAEIHVGDRVRFASTDDI
jgi:hypothetical protein